MTIPQDSWLNLTIKMEQAKLELIVAKRKIRSKNAKINFENFLRGFVIETESIAFIYAQCYPSVKNPTADYNMVKLMALGAMSAYGGWDAKDPVAIEDYWTVPYVPPWWEHKKRRLR
jgi:hypothetical protein